MYNLLTINNVTCPHVDKGNFSVTKSDLYNTYTGEDGHSTIEQVRVGKNIIDVSYKGLLESDIITVIGAITLVSSVTVLDPATGTTTTFNAKISNIKSQKIVYENNISAWTLSFKIEEL